MLDQIQKLYNMSLLEMVSAAIELIIFAFAFYMILGTVVTSLDNDCLEFPYIWYRLR